LKRSWIWLLPSLVGIAVGGCKQATPAADDDAAAKPIVQVSVENAKRGDIRSILSVTGSLSPLPDHEAKISPLVPGRIREVFVKTGDVAQKGQVVATLDPGTTPGQVQQAEAAVQVAKETLTQARFNLTSQIQTQRTSVSAADLGVQAAKVALLKLRAGSRPQEIIQAEANLASANAALENAEQNLTRSQTLFSQGILARKDFESAQQQQKTARAAVTTAEQGLSLAKQGNRPEDIRAGEVALSQAEDLLRAAKAQAIQNRSKMQDVQIAAGQLAAAEGALRSIQATSKALSITSPVAGVVVGRTVNAGETVDVTTAIATIVNLDEVRLLLNVPAESISSVSPGQSVRFSTDAMPSIEREASVAVINRSVDPATNSVQIEARARNGDRSLRDDGFIKAEIVLKLRSDTVLVPAASVVELDGKPTVFLAGADKVAHAHEVKVGLKTTDQVEILSGIKPGDKVITTGAYELDDGSKIEVGS
jgi:RND family efflux transporter MFP subunit